MRENNAAQTQRERYHILKTDPDVFQAVLSGAKTFEIRLNDRGYAVGDVLGLRETKHTGAEMRAGAPLEYTGRECQRFVSHVLTGYGLADGWCCLSFRLPHAAGEGAPVADERAAFARSITGRDDLEPHQVHNVIDANGSRWATWRDRAALATVPLPNEPPIRLSAEVVEYLKEGIENATQCDEADIDYDFANELGRLIQGPLFGAPPASAPVAGKAVALELRGVPETIKESDGFWRPCAGCHELNEGRDTGPYSAVLGCHLGQGCSECGGIGAIWDSTDYQTMADDMARDMGQSVSAAPLASVPVAGEAPDTYRNMLLEAVHRYGNARAMAEHDIKQRGQISKTVAAILDLLDAAPQASECECARKSKAVANSEGEL